MNLNKFLKEERVILIICFLVFIVSFAYAFYYKIKPAVDAAVYNQVAMNIVEGRGFRLDLDVPLSIDGVIAYQGPFYQFFLAGIYKIFGHYYEIVWIIHALLRALSALLLFLICKKIFGDEGRKMGWIAAVFFGFYPDLIEISAMLMTETLFIFSMIMTLYIFTRYYEQINFKSIFSLGLSFGAAILIRSTVMIFLPIFIFYFLRRRAYKNLILFLILTALILTPWTIRNYLVYHKFIPTMANGYNLWVGNHMGGDGEGAAVMPQYPEIINRYGIIGANSYALGQFKSFVAEHPFLYAELTATRLIKYFSFIRPMGFWFYQHGIGQFIFILISALASVFLFTFGFAGIFAALKKERRTGQLIYLIVFAFLTCASVIPFLIETRYRLPIYPFMAIFSGFFIARMIIFKREYSKYLIVAFIILSFSSIINIILEYDKIIEKLGQIFS